MKLSKEAVGQPIEHSHKKEGHDTIEKRENLQDYRIGFVADLHEAKDPKELLERLDKADIDEVVVNGDLANSEAVSKLIREFKSVTLDPSSVETILSGDELLTYHDFIKRGYPAIRAFMLSRFKHNPDLWIQEMNFVEKEVESHAKLLEKLPNPSFLVGNLEAAYPEKLLKIKEIFESKGIKVIDRPLIKELSDNESVIYWPSVDIVGDGDISIELDKIVESLRDQLKNKKKVIVVAHEQLFYGPSPERYLKGVAKAGLKARTVPQYMPNPSRSYILKLLSSILPETEIVYISGHIHDPQEVITAGFPLQPGKHGGMQWGYSHRKQEGGGRDLKSIEMFQIPIDANAVLTTSANKTNFKVYK